MWRMPINHPCKKKSMIKSLMLLISELMLLLIFNNIKYTSLSYKVIILNLFLFLSFISFQFISVYSIGIITSFTRFLYILILSNFKINLFYFILFFIILIFFLLKYGRSGEPLLECRKINLSPLFASITASGIISWLLSLDTYTSLIVYGSSVLSALHLACVNLDAPYSTLAGLLGPMPGLGGFLAAWSATSPLPLSCGRGPRLGWIVGVLAPSSLARSLTSDLGVSCRSGEWRAPVWSARVLVVGSKSVSVEGPHLIVELVPDEMRLEEFERSLERAVSAIDSGRSAVIRVGIGGERSLASSMVSIVATYASERHAPVVVISCSPSSEDFIPLLVKGLSKAPLVVVKVCFLPGERIVRLFTGPAAARVVCEASDPEVLSWALSSVLGASSDKMLGELAYLLRGGLCVASNVCGSPGVVLIRGEG